MSQRSIRVWARILGLAAVALISAKALHSRLVPPSPLSFEDVTEEAGINFSHFNAHRDSLLPEDVGSGAAWGDYDNDGDEDLYLVNFAGPFLMEPEKLRKREGNRLYRNNGDGTFTDVTKKAGVGHVGWDNACLWFDFDNDGWLDLAVTHYEGVILYRNLKNGTFDDITEKAGLKSIKKYLLGMAAGDYDKDGDLDLYLCGYVKFDREAARPVTEGGKRPIVAGRPAVWTNPTSFPAESNVLLRKNGNSTFTDVTKKAGVANPEGKSMQALFCDFDNDGWQDLYVCNDVGTPDVLFRNKHDGTFEEISVEAGTHDFRAGMGIAIGDLWHRGWMDFFVTHWVAEDHALWKNMTPEFNMLAFEDVAPQFGLTPKPSAYVGWGAGLYDFDNDGYLDLMLVNGSTIEDELTLEVLKHPELIPQSPQLFWWSREERKFVELGERGGSFFGEHKVSRGAAFADYDDDGRVDAVVVNHGERATLLKNVTRKAGNWLKVKLEGTVSNRLAVGARVKVKAGKFVQTREVVCGCSYLSTDSFIQHFGLGTSSKADWVEVKFPSGIFQRVTNIPANQTLTIVEQVRSSPL